MGIRDQVKITSSQLQTLCAIAEAAGREVMAVYGEDFETWNEVAGGAVTDLEGSPLNYGLERPLLNPGFLAAGDKQWLSTASRLSCLPDDSRAG